MHSTSFQTCLPPFLRREAERQLPAIHATIERVVRSGRFLFGAELEALEGELAAAVGREHCAGCGTGTDAIELALRAIGIGAGDRVITQSHSSPFTVLAIFAAGATPVLVDSSEDDFGMDLPGLDLALQRGAQAVVPVHLYGQPVRIREVLELATRHGVPVVEDCAQAQGALVDERQVGTFGVAGCFSFYPTKNLGAFGDGGAVVTDDPAIDRKVRLLRNGGLCGQGMHDGRGMTSRLNEVQAGVLRLRLCGLEDANERRREHAAAYARELDDCVLVLPVERPGSRWAPHQYVVRHPAREAIRVAAAALDHVLLVHYPLPIHLQRGFESPDFPRGSLPAAERLAAEVLSLPTHPEMTGDERLAIAAVVNSVAGRERGR